MEAHPITPENKEDRLRVPVGQGAFEYVNALLQPVYAQGLREAQKEGREAEYKGSDRVAIIVQGIRNQLILSNAELPNNPYLNLSKDDVRFIEDLAYSQPSGTMEDMGNRKGYINHLSLAYETREKELKRQQPQQPNRLRSAVSNLFKRK